MSQICKAAPYVGVIEFTKGAALFDLRNRDTHCLTVGSWGDLLGDTLREDAIADEVELSPVNEQAKNIEVARNALISIGVLIPL
ncbi:hypothetical protein N9052_00480 [bacterium]|nr:hypothetical protein [bacterium]